jgi:hypothetical protein
VNFPPRSRYSNTVLARGIQHTLSCLHKAAGVAPGEAELSAAAITGLAFISNELDGKRQEILIEAVPGIRKMAALADAKQRDNRLDVLKEAARARNVELSIYRIASGEEIAAAIDSVKTSGPQALNVCHPGCSSAFVKSLSSALWRRS